MFDHVGLNVSDYGASRAFYEQALAPLGYRIAMAFDQWKAAGFGASDKPEFWISERPPTTSGAHVCFACDDHATVDAFPGGRRQGQRGAGAPRALSPDLLRRVRPRPRRQQCRGGVPWLGID